MQSVNQGHHREGLVQHMEVHIVRCHASSMLQRAGYGSRGRRHGETPRGSGGRVAEAEPRILNNGVSLCSQANLPLPITIAEAPSFLIGNRRKNVSE